MRFLRTYTVGYRYRLYGDSCRAAAPLGYFDHMVFTMSIAIDSMLNKPYAQTRSEGIAVSRRSPAGRRLTAILHHSNGVPNTPSKMQREKARPGERTRARAGGRLVELPPCSYPRIIS